MTLHRFLRLSASGFCLSLATFGLLACAVLGNVSAPSLASRATAQSNSPFGLNSHIASRHKDEKTLQVPVELVAQTGTKWVREDFHWHRIEKLPGVFDWSYFDQTVNLYNARGINIVGVLTPAVGWATPFAEDAANQVSFFPPDPNLYAEFVQTVVSRYKGRVNYWEVWNEPENEFYWKPKPESKAYATLLKLTYPVIKKANPEAKVLLAGIVPFGLQFLRELAADGVWDSFDILSLHPFVDPFGPEEAQIGSHGIGEVKTLFAQYGSKPIWATEFGWSTGASDRSPHRSGEPEDQANYLVRGAILMHAAGAERVFWYSLKDTQVKDGQPFNSYGLFGLGKNVSDYSQPKPAYQAFKTLNEQLSKTKLVGLQNTADWQPVFGFEVFDETPEFSRSSKQVYQGSFAAQMNYKFTAPTNEYLAFIPRLPILLPGQPSQLGLWVFGDDSGHVLRAQIRDATGQILQFRLGVVGGSGWQFLSTSIMGEVEAGNIITKTAQSSTKLTFPVSLVALILDDEPDSRNGTGTIYLDDFSVAQGPEIYAVRFAKEDVLPLTVVDVLWALQPVKVKIPTFSRQAVMNNRNGNSTLIFVSDDQIPLMLGPSPIYLSHIPKAGPILAQTGIISP